MVEWNGERRVLVPGGTGTVGGGVVRAFLAAGATVVVPTRSASRADAMQAQIGQPESGVLETIVSDYSTFEAAATMVEEVARRFGGVDDVVAPIGDLWKGAQLTAITPDDWESAFVVLARTHLAVARAAVPHLQREGAYSVIVGQTAQLPVPGLGLVSMEQTAVLMMQRVLAVEHGAARRLFALVLGQIIDAEGDSSVGLKADDVGAAAVGLSSSDEDSSIFELPDHEAAVALVDRLRTGPRT